MKTKITLTIEENTIKKAKSYAKHTSRSLSELVENYLEILIEKNYDRTGLSPQLRKIAGAVKLPKNFDEKAEL